MQRRFTLLHSSNPSGFWLPCLGIGPSVQLSQESLQIFKKCQGMSIKFRESAMHEYIAVLVFAGLVWSHHCMCRMDRVCPAEMGVLSNLSLWYAGTWTLGVIALLHICTYLMSDSWTCVQQVFLHHQILRSYHWLTSDSTIPVLLSELPWSTC